MVLVVAATACLWAARPAGAGEVPVGVLRGRVVDGGTGEGLAGAWVVLRSPDRTTVSRADGSWEFDGVEAGPHEVRVTAPDYEDATRLLPGDGRVHDVMLERRPYLFHETVTVIAGRSEQVPFDVPRSVTVVESADLDRRLEAQLAASRNGKLEAALQRIVRWEGEFPATGKFWEGGAPMEYGACWGSNGERDYMRQVALDALKTNKETP